MAGLERANQPPRVRGRVKPDHRRGEKTFSRQSKLRCRRTAAGWPARRPAMVSWDWAAAYIQPKMALVTNHFRHFADSHLHGPAVDRHGGLADGFCQRRMGVAG